VGFLKFASIPQLIQGGITAINAVPVGNAGPVARLRWLTYRSPVRSGCCGPLRKVSLGRTAGGRPAIRMGRDHSVSPQGIGEYELLSTLARRFEPSSSHHVRGTVFMGNCTPRQVFAPVVVVLCLLPVGLLRKTGPSAFDVAVQARTWRTVRRPVGPVWRRRPTCKRNQDNYNRQQKPGGGWCKFQEEENCPTHVDDLLAQTACQCRTATLQTPMAWWMNGDLSHPDCAGPRRAVAPGLPDQCPQHP